MSIKTRKPTGKPSWPILLLAGREKAGKSWAAVSASASAMVGRTLYIGIGEDDPDEYALIPGADFEIVVHDGTFPGILAAVREAVAEPVGEHPTLLIIDSMTRLWNLIGDNMQAIANRRAKGRKNAAGDYTISMDLWNVAADQWTAVMNALRIHQGPAILTARLDPVAVMENGQPTAQKEWKIQGHKSLPYDATAIVEMRERGQFLITGVKSAKVQLDKPKAFPEFTVDRLWTDLGLADGTGERTHATVQADHSGAEPGPVATPSAPQVAQVDWPAKILAAKTRTDLLAVRESATEAGELQTVIGSAHKATAMEVMRTWNLPAPQGAVTVSALINAVGQRMPAEDSSPEPDEPDADSPAGTSTWATVQPGEGGQQA
ncbi:hypothetical protein [uncultured Microbacterium sp.]|uniref:hypothetical protein n=1 Tax=uncultured Microbacterium sp. TaxID=191216 RepID=UPI0025E393BC|nr:hypothetical protein [uncultured Microbacterium sp.]